MVPLFYSAWLKYFKNYLFFSTGKKTKALTHLEKSLGKEELERLEFNFAYVIEKSLN